MVITIVITMVITMVEPRMLAWHGRRPFAIPGHHLYGTYPDTHPDTHPDGHPPDTFMKKNT